MPTHHIIGLMSGSSLDGLDIAHCQFTFDGRPQKGQIRWQILDAETIAYPPEWQARLRKTTTMSPVELLETDADLGRWMGNQVRTFVAQRKLKIDLVASHGHTVFHFPEKGFSLQIGQGNHLAEKCGLPVIFDFRTADIAAGGQGAPLAPVVDEWLLTDYDFFLNLGGIANIACHTRDGFVGYDIIGTNQILDALAGKLNLAYDSGGQLARKGSLNPTLYNQLQKLDFLQQEPPKSLDNQWVRDNMTGPTLAFDDTIPNKMATIVELAAFEIAKEINRLIPYAKHPNHQLLITGGGAHNTYLIERIKHFAPSNLEIIIPTPQLINYKESLLIALLALLRQYGSPNSSPLVTGAGRNTVGGVLTM